MYFLAPTGSAIDDDVSAVRNALRSNLRPPLVAGMLPVSSDSVSLFYKSGQSAHFVNLYSATAEEFLTLSNACQAATFGRNSEDVLDETYRKAGKLDRADFLTGVSDELPRLLNIIQDELVEGDEDHRNIRAELYKLNVYEEGSFFKPHKDTPRGDDMFGSLVITFPTPHEGGALTIRHTGKEWMINSGKDLANLQSPHITYAAFFSDVEHEVLPVVSGHRVTITYNLYWASKRARDNTSASESTLKIATDREAEEIKRVLEQLLSNGACLPDGGYLAFGLRHQYPISEGSSDVILTRLKGADATIARICRDLGLKTTTKIVYDGSQLDWYDDEEEDYQRRPAGEEGKEPVPAKPRKPTRLFLFDKLPSPQYGVEEFMVMLQYQGAQQIQGNPLSQIPFKESVWLTELTDYSRIDQPFISYGNQAVLNTFYVDVCLVAEIGQLGSRKL